MRNLIFIALGASLASCGGQQSASLPFTMLSQSALFDKDSVENFLSYTPTSQEDSSRKLFLSAMDEFKNKSDAGTAIDFLLASLRIYPSATSYYELGNALLEEKKYKEALDAYHMAAKLDFNPYGNLLFKQTCCYAGLENDIEVYNYLSYAVENGFVDRNKIFNNIHLKDYRDDHQFISAYNEAMSGNGNPEEILWQGYFRDFPKGSFPLSLDSGSFARMKDIKYIPYDYEQYIPEMRDNKFSRDVGNEFFYVARLTGNKDYKLLVYGCQSYENDGAPVYFILASFNNKGVMVDKKIIAGAETFDQEFKEATIVSHERVEIKSYKLIYEQDPKEKGYEGNRVIQREETGSYHLIIGAGGKISESTTML